MEVKGTAVESIPLFVKSKFGDEGHRDWLKSLSPKAREQFQSMIITTKWYPMKEMLEEPTLKICELFYNGKIEGAMEQGRFSAEYGLKGIYKVFVKLGSPEFIIGRATAIFVTYYQPSAMEVVNKGDKTQTLRITKFDEPSKVVEHRILGWMEKALEIGGSKSPSAKIVQSMTDGAPFTDFIISW